MTLIIVKYNHKHFLTTVDNHLTQFCLSARITSSTPLDTAITMHDIALA